MSTTHVWALAASGRDLYVAGNFGTVANNPSYGFAIWHDGNLPALKARFRDGRLVLSWPAQFQYAAVEVADSLPSTLWRPVAGLSTAISGSPTNDVEVTLLPLTPQAFYRLRL